MRPVCAGLLVKPLVFLVSNSMQQKMLSLLPTRISLPPILACVSWLYKPRKTGQLPKNVGESPLRRCMLIDINSIHPARTMQEVYELIVQADLSANERRGR